MKICILLFIIMIVNGDPTYFIYRVHWVRHDNSVTKIGPIKGDDSLSIEQDDVNTDHYEDSINKYYWSVLEENLRKIYNNNDYKCYYNYDYIEYDSLYSTTKVPLFAIKNNQINISLDDFLLGINIPAYSDYVVNGGQLYIKINGAFEKVFSAFDTTIVRSSFGYSQFIKKYKEVSFFGRSYKEVYSFYLNIGEDYSENEILLWFNKNYKVIRIEGTTHGILVIDNPS